MSAPVTQPPLDPTNLVRPAAWTLAAMYAKRSADRHVLVAEAQARSTALTAAITSRIAADPTAGPSEHEQQL